NKYKYRRIVMNAEEWKSVIETERKQKDEFFSGYQSPLSFEKRKDFQGLSYYPMDMNYKFELELVEHLKKEFLKIEDTKGDIRNFVRYGEFNFKIDGVDCKLQVYKSELQDNVLFIPFKDLTTGKETYSAGRYLDMEEYVSRLPSGKWVLDFNKSYNPWCAYSDNYACPITPAENLLKVEIRAGEKYLMKKNE
ncbi:MAG: DUF1684 domain-containing protein, partial [Candidatus Omnitrophica bacterium]|nr:DUF1684 domain-containing protein [Candidatus Omnitrophota bacterium]